MNFSQKLKKLNQRYSYNLFSLIGVFILIFRLFCFFTNNYTYNFAIVDYLLLPACFLLNFIILIWEQVFQLKIQKEKFLENKILNFIKFVGRVQLLSLNTTFKFYPLYTNSFPPTHSNPHLLKHNSDMRFCATA